MVYGLTLHQKLFLFQVLQILLNARIIKQQIFKRVSFYIQFAYVNISIPLSSTKKPR